jgi:demethylmenaquinone methyltransferase/2-methoxy-6-polyprenyl-1,4-benzoquinol methylase
MQRVLNALEIHASERGEDIAVRDADGTAHSWRTVADGVRRVQRWVRSAAVPGGFVAVSMPSGGAAWMAMLGVARAGCVPVLLPALVAENTERMVRASIGVPPRIDASTWPDAVAHAPAESPAAPGAGVVLLSSGTTGCSRLVMRSAAAVDRVASTLVDAGLPVREDVVVSCIPMSHAYGFEHALLAPVLAGARVHVLSSFSLDAVAEELEAGASALLLVPATVDALAEAAVPAPQLRSATVAGAPLPQRVRARFEAAYPGILVDLYGATEVGTIWLDRGAGGVPVQGVQVRLVDVGAGDSLQDAVVGAEGEIAVHSDAMLDGIVGAGGTLEPATTDGFMRTGDLGVRAADGSFRVTGRSKLTFDVGGLKVNRVEVEHALESLPEVRAAVVEAQPVTDTVNRVAARVELRHGQAAIDVASVRERLASMLPPHALPRSIEVVASLPRTASGKILRAAPAGTVSVAPPVVHRGAGLERRADREAFTERLFDQSAAGYDNSSGVAFLRVGRWYRRRMLRTAGALAPGRAHLDVGSGTGLCAAISQEIVGPGGRTVALDPSTGMLEMARRRGVRETVVGRAERLPFADSTFDLVSMSYMLRHVEDLSLAFAEAYRVLRPGGRIVIFELTSPSNPVARAAFRGAMHWAVPAVGVVASMRPATFPMMRYWAQTIDAAVRPERIVDALAAAGFAGARHQLELGVFSCYRGVRAPVSP